MITIWLKNESCDNKIFFINHCHNNEKIKMVYKKLFLSTKTIDKTMLQHFHIRHMIIYFVK